MDLEKIQAEAEALKNRLARQMVNPEEKRLAELQAKIEAEEKRLNSKEYKTALKTVDDLADEAEAKKQTVLSIAEDLKDALHDWNKTVMERRRLAKEYRIETKDLYNAEAGKMGRLLDLENRIMKWFNDVRLAEALNEKPKAQPVHNRSILKVGKREKMMRERYPENTENGKLEKMMRERYPE